jgi:hypothetical protein
MEVFKIRRKTDGLFSTGGSRPSFSKQGKLWKRKSDLTCHINLVVSSYKGTSVYEECELVIFKVTETEVSSQLLREYIQEREDAKQQRELELQQARDRRAQAARKRMYEELKEEFEPN